MYCVPPLLSLSGFLGMAVYGVLCGPRTGTNRLFVRICLVSALLYLDILYAFTASNAAAALWVSRVDHCFLAFLAPLYISFFHRYLGAPPPRLLIPAAYAFACLLMGLALTPWYISGMRPHWFGLFAEPGSFYPLLGFSTTGATVYAGVLLFRVIRKEGDWYRRRQLWFVFAGFGGLGVLNGFNFLPIYGQDVYPPGNFAFIPMLAFAYGLFRFNLLNAATIVNRGLVYSVLTACLTGLYALILTVMTSLSRKVAFSKSILFPVLFFLLVTLVFGPLKNRIQRLVDRLFFRQKYDYQQTIRKVSRMIVSVLDIDEIGRTVIRTLTGAMNVQTSRLIILSLNGQAPLSFDYPESGENTLLPQDVTPALHAHLMERRATVAMSQLVRKGGHDGKARALASDMASLGAIMLVPLVFKDHVTGYFLLGAKRSGEPFAREDVDLLETLSSQTALAVENARSYRQVDELNRKLEQKVAHRTRSLRRALEEKERTQEALIRSESLAAIGQLVAGVAHELNNPLTSAMSLVQTAMEDMGQGSPDPETLEDLAFANRELARARQIVRSLLGLSRQTDIVTERVGINTVVRDALRILENAYRGRRFSVEESYGEDLPAVQGNFAHLGQVVLNIVQNAFQAMQGSDKAVHLATGYDAAECVVLFSCIDAGPGIDPSIRKDIFKPFFTTKAPGKGTGLGLYITHEIVRRHGGAIDYVEQPDGGAGFTVRLPAFSPQVGGV
jgi:two-component system NtrC family sensor kinase